MLAEAICTWSNGINSTGGFDLVERGEGGGGGSWGVEKAQKMFIILRLSTQAKDAGRSAYLFGFQYQAAGTLA